MASVINTNMASLYAQKNLSGAQNALSTSVERLSSGLRINRAKDDAAGLGISEKIKSQVTSLNQGLRNANDAISMVQTAEGSLSEVSSILQRMKELSVQARNDSLSATQRSFISDELVALKNEINAIAERTTFNDLSLLKNALRTQVAVPAATDATKLVNGASLLDGISVSNLAVKNTNAGTYTITTGTQTPIANQASEASGNFGGAEVDTVEVTGTYATNSVFSVSVAITGGPTITASYTAVAADVASAADADDRTAIAFKVAAELNRQSQLATGQALGVFSSGNKIYIGGNNDGVSLTTTAVVVANGAGATGTYTLGSENIRNSARTITIADADAVEGNIFTLSIGSKEYSVVAGSGTQTDIRNAVATAFRGLLGADYSGITGTNGSIITAAGNALGIADISLRVNRLADGAVVTNQASTVSARSLSDSTASRTVSINNFDIVEGRRAVLRVGNPEFYTEVSAIVDANDTANDVAGKLRTLIGNVLGSGGTNVSGSDNQIIFGSTTAMGMGNIELEFRETVEGAKVDSLSTVSAKNLSLAERTITLNQSDLVPGRVASVMIGSKEYAVKVADGDSAADVAYKLASLIDDVYVPRNGTVAAATLSAATVASTAASSATATFSSMSKGDSVTLNGLTFTAARALSANEAALAFAGLTLNSTASPSGATAYGVYSGSFTTNLQTTVSGAVATMTNTAGSGAAIAVASSARSVAEGLSRSGSVLTIGRDSALGLTDISVSVKSITDPGKITITANADTGIGGTSQSINVGTIAAGASKSFDFDNLGVSFTLNNSRASAVNATSFEAFTPKVNTLAIESAMDGEALFQVGAGTRDNVVLDGFKDIRMTGQNKNVGSEKEVFDKVYETLTTISANTTESLSEANFATLENRIEDAITMVSDFRSYFGGQQNRIEFAIANIQAQSENLTAANSRIVDTDYAAETANLTKTQIMQQAATAMLAQANQMPNVILALLK